MNTKIISIIIVSSLLITSCGSFNPFSPDSKPISVSKEIGPNGGTVATPDGRLILSIPAGALGKTETISVEELNPDNLPQEFRDMKAVYKFGPDGLTFNQPVSVFFEDTFAGATEESGFGFPSVAMGLTSEQSESPEMIDNLLIRKTAQTNGIILEGKLTHFSNLFIEHQSVKLTVIAPDEIKVGETDRVRMRISESNRDITNHFFYKPYDEYTSIEAHFTDNTYYDNERLQPVEPPLTHEPFKQVSNNDLILGVPYTCISRGDEELHIQVFVTFRHPDFQVYEDDDDSFTLRYEITDWEPEDRPFMDDKTVDAPIVKCVDQDDESVNDPHLSIINFNIQQTDNPGEAEASGIIEFTLPNGEEPDLFLDWGDLTIEKVEDTKTERGGKEDDQASEITFSTTHQFDSPNLFTPKLNAIWNREAFPALPSLFHSPALNIFPEGSTDEQESDLVWTFSNDFDNDNTISDLNMRGNLANALAPPSIKDLGPEGGKVASSDNKLLIDIPPNTFDGTNPLVIQKFDLSVPFGFEEKNKIVLYDINLPESDFSDNDWQLRANYSETSLPVSFESDMESLDHSFSLSLNPYGDGPMSDIKGRVKILTFDESEETHMLFEPDSPDDLEDLNLGRDQVGLRTRIFTVNNNNFNFFDTAETTITIPGHELTVVKDGNGSGTVVGNDEIPKIRLRGEAAPKVPITCGMNCSSTFIEGKTVTLTAKADPGSHFMGFSNNCQQSQGFACTITIFRDETVTATFVKKDEVEDRTVADQPQGGITGHLRLNGQPLSGAIVQVIKPDGYQLILITGSDGRYRLDDLQPGEVSVSFSPEADYYCPGGSDKSVTVMSNQLKHVNFECFTRQEGTEPEVAEEGIRDVVDGFTEGKWSIGGGVGLTTTSAFDEPVGDQTGIIDTDIDGSSTQFNIYNERRINWTPPNVSLPFKFWLGGDISFRRVNFTQYWEPQPNLPNRTVGQVDIWSFGFYGLANKFIDLGLQEFKFVPFVRIGGGILWNNGKFNLFLPDNSQQTRSRLHSTAYPMIGAGADITIGELWAMRIMMNSVFGVGGDSHFAMLFGFTYNPFRGNIK